MKTQYKTLTDNYEGQLFRNYHLTDLMLLKKDGRKIKFTENTAVYELLNSKLKEYGFDLFGQFERDGLIFRGLRLLKDFPIENEPIIKQLYGYKNFTTHIQLRGFDDYAVAFDYNVDTGECELQRHSWGSVTNRVNYKSLYELLNEIKVKDYNTIFFETKQIQD